MLVLQMIHFIRGAMLAPVVTLLFVITLFLTACSGLSSLSPEPDKIDENPTQAVITKTIRQMAIVAEQKKDYPLAVQQYNKLLARLPNDESSVLGLARNLRYVGSSDDAIRVLETKKDIFSVETIYLVELGKSFIAANRNTEALETLELAAKIGSSEWQLYSALGIVYDLHEMFDKATIAYETALELSPGNPEVYNNLAFSYALRGDINEAIRILNNEAPKKSSGVQMRQNLALFYCLTGDMEKSEKLSRMDLDDKDVRNNNDICLQMQGK